MKEGKNAQRSSGEREKVTAELDGRVASAPTPNLTCEIMVNVVKEEREESADGADGADAGKGALTAAGVAPEEVTAQYRRAIAGCLEMVRFGAMLIEVSFNLTREIGARGGGHTPPEETLKGWLAEHCPEVNYGTAMRFKSLAEGVQRACGIPSGTPMRLALPGPAGEIDMPLEWTREGCGRSVSEQRIRALRRSVWELVDGKSARQLQFQFMADPVSLGGAREGAGQPARPDDAMVASGAAWATVGKKIDAAMNWRFARFLPEAIAKEALETTMLLANALKERLAELKNH